jgi:hypothetical protein
MVVEQTSVFQKDRSKSQISVANARDGQFVEIKRRVRSCEIKVVDCRCVFVIGARGQRRELGLTNQCLDKEVLQEIVETGKIWNTWAGSRLYI